ncbi:MAG: hypothetical protein IPL46_21610 [Saprospiraceae bacterium]|nr:hypothetical protein [Saprospiraceae bacterium]
MKNLRYFFVTLLIVLPLLMFSQQRFSLEVRGGASLTTKDLVDADLKTGFGLEGIMDFRIVNHIGVYGGWAWNRFSSDQSFAGTSSDFEETGYAFGVKYFETIGSSPIDAYVRVGAIYNHLEIENTEEIL